MDALLLMVKFLVLLFVVVSVIAFILKQALFNSTEGAVKRLDTAIGENRKKHVELNDKIKEADEELARRKKEADELAKKMIGEAEEKAKEEKEKMLQQIRKESEEIISKAQRTKDQVRVELEKESEMKLLSRSADIMTLIFSKKSMQIISDQLLEEFLVSLQEVDLSQIGEEIDVAGVVSAIELSSDKKEKITSILRGKLNRDIKIDASVDPKIVGGVVLRFGSLALDGSLQNHIDEAATKLKEEIEKG